MNTTIKSIISVSFMEKLRNFGGGWIHQDILQERWASNGIFINKVGNIEVASFTLLEMLKATLKSMTLSLSTLRKFSFNDIIISESPYPPDVILSSRLSRKFNKPMTIYVHHVTPGFFFYPFRRGIFRVAVNRIYIVILLAFAKIFQIPIFLDNPNTIKINGLLVLPDLDAVAFLNSDKYHAADPNQTVDICYIGRIQKSKGIEDIIKVVRIIVRQYNFTPKVILAGRGEEKYVRKIKKMIDGYGLSNNIILKGFISDEEKIELLRSSKLFISLSYEEGWSLSVMEAAACGLPVVAYELPAYYYLRGNYFKVRPSDILNCAETVVNVISDYQSSYLTGKKAKELAIKFNYDFISNQQLIFFKKIIRDFYDSDRGF